MNGMNRNKKNKNTATYAFRIFDISGVKTLRGRELRVVGCCFICACNRVLHTRYVSSDYILMRDVSSLLAESTPLLTRKRVPLPSDITYRAEATHKIQRLTHQQELCAKQATKVQRLTHQKHLFEAPCVSDLQQLQRKQLVVVRCGDASIGTAALRYQHHLSICFVSGVFVLLFELTMFFLVPLVTHLRDHVCRIQPAIVYIGNCLTTRCDATGPATLISDAPFVAWTHDTEHQ